MMQALRLSTANRDFLAELRKMLGNEQHGERAAAAQKASDFLQERTLTWDEVIEALTGRPFTPNARPVARPVPVSLERMPH